MARAGRPLCGALLLGEPKRLVLKPHHCRHLPSREHHILPRQVGLHARVLVWSPVRPPPMSDRMHYQRIVAAGAVDKANGDLPCDATSS